jgi:hypothetical protein
MSETRIMRGRKVVYYEREPPGGLVETSAIRTMCRA